MDRGLILVNTGSGKGKTTAALGTALRALGQGMKVAFLQFIKNQETGESRFLKALSAKLDPPAALYYNRLGLGFLKDRPDPEDRAKAEEALREAERLLASGYDLVVLDEFCVAVSRGLISLEDALGLLRAKPAEVNIILTGRGCPEEIIALADTVTEMKPIKHAFERGVKARRGLEF